jgi:phage terminase large subunit-like protein
MLIGDGTPKAEVYVCACDRNQARIIFNESANYVKESPQLSELAEVVDSRARIVYHEQAAFLQVLSADAHRNDGLDSSFTAIDEIHRHPNRKLFDVMERAGKARPQPLMVVITTYGPSTTDGSIWAELHNEGKAQFAGERPDAWRSMYFCASAEPIAVTTTADVNEGDTVIPCIRVEQPIDVGPIEFDLSHVSDIGTKAKVQIVEPVKRFQTFLKVAPLDCEIPKFSEAKANLEWCNLHGVKRANPSADIIFPAEETLEAAKLVRSPIHEAETKQLDFNIVSGSGQRAISAAIWKACGERKVQPKTLIGRTVYGGMDFAFSNDLVALSICVPLWDVTIPFIQVPKEEARADLLSWVWMADERIEKREEEEQFPYRYHAKQPYLFDDRGCIRFCEGRVVDFSQIVTEAYEILSQFQVVAVAYDPNYAQFGINQLMSLGVTCVEHRQGKQYMGPATKQLLKMIYGCQIGHGHNPVLDRAVEGAVLEKPDTNGNTKFSKAASKNRIDPLVGHVMSVGFATNPPIQQSGAWADSSSGTWGD